jgi:hypothetical protein
MIEWIPIEDFVPEQYEVYLICYEPHSGGESLGYTIHFENSDRFKYAEHKVSHAAKVNMPSEDKIKPAIESVLSQLLARLVKQEVSAALKEKEKGND